MAEVKLTFSDPNIDEVEVSLYRGAPMLDRDNLPEPIMHMDQNSLYFNDTVPEDMVGNVIAYAVAHKRGTEEPVVGPIILATTIPNTLLVIDAVGNYGTDEDGNFIYAEIP